LLFQSISITNLVYTKELQMRKKLAILASLIALNAVGWAWYLGWWQWPTTEVPVLDQAQSWPRSKHPPQYIPPDDGNAEPADTIEPLVVESSVPAPVLPTSLPQLEAPPVYLTPDVKQAPRPDAEPDKAPRMATVDDVVILPWPLEPWARILQEAVLSQFKRIEKPKVADPAEETEPKEPMPPDESPLPLQVPDYHHQYPSCPYTGGHCPLPYPYYPRR
jgi:hypothetical protein